MKNTLPRLRTAIIPLACCILAATIAIGAQASAFSDLKGHAAVKEVIMMDKNIAAPSGTYDAAVTLDKAAAGVNKATVTVSNLPNPGYGLVIERIEFSADKTAVIYFKVTSPKPGSMNPQVISAGTAVTYLPEGYTAVAQATPGSATSAASRVTK
ncbi:MULTISPECIES: protease complex subunit PrcB family protein [unclassified Paenibacillus]|uniref:protease complex subunit PrcB family protein n=1 Tax=unclassified Paenibacillus TaxID=185978 RepID=UPI0003E1DE00|nr:MULTISPECIES: protease complex subunit PrcB family protein [unclassified Paenibacillus]ETT45607.1 S-layer domain-containing protein [Paenibacillus sp. FSL R7-269]OMF85855.1 hypothetical protein BK147_30995 [Paenibacillus sp. FSL R7-0337]